MIRLIVVSLLLALTGCAEFYAGKSLVASEGALIADEVRNTAEYALCKGMTVGAWVRAYGSNPAKAAAWRTLCAQTTVETPAGA